jgi:hypothetical protein
MPKIEIIRTYPNYHLFSKENNGPLEGERVNKTKTIKLTRPT